MDGYQFISSILQSLTSLSWPLALVGCFWIMRKEISALMPKLKLKHGETELSFIQDVIETTKRETVNQMIKIPLIDGTISATSDLQGLSLAQLRQEVTIFSREIRDVEAQMRDARDSDLLDKNISWDEKTKRMMDRSRAQNNEWRSLYQPKGIALRDEMNRRLGRTPDPASDGSVALQHGMLAGVSPISDAALELEALARALGPSLV